MENKTHLVEDSMLSNFMTGDGPKESPKGITLQTITLKSNLLKKKGESWVWHLPYSNFMSLQRYLLILILLSTVVSHGSQPLKSLLRVPAQNSQLDNQQAQVTPDHQKTLTELDYLLSVERFHYYIQNLVDHLESKVSEEKLNLLKSITPEEIYLSKIKIEKLKNQDEWTGLITQLRPQMQSHEINWGYEFFKRKLIEGFSLKVLGQQKQFVKPKEEVNIKQRSLPQLQADEVLLDTSRYISEKTTQGFMWHALINQIDFEFHVGTEREFLTRMSEHKKVIVAEINPLARNYNKIYLLYDQEQNKYSYAFTQISGADRIQHLKLGIRLTRFLNFRWPKDLMLKVFGSVFQSHQQQYLDLKAMWKKLPKADVVIMGQKAAFEGIFDNMIMLEELLKVKDKSETALALKKMVQKNGTLATAIYQGSYLKKLYFNEFGRKSPVDRSSFQTEQLSHGMSDYELKTKEKGTLRIRLISNVWGDEALPIAKVIKEFSPDAFYYIGTAGALVDSQLKVGDVIQPAKTYTQNHELLDLHTHTQTQITTSTLKGYRLGQVRTPFEETKSWYQKWKGLIDLVELEVGYLRKTVGDQFPFFPYLLISDIVGSSDQSLAHAAKDSSKRKNGQLNLIESILSHHQVSSVQTPAEAYKSRFAERLEKLKSLKSNRDEVELFMLAQKSMAQEKMTEKSYEKLFKSEAPSFTRKELWNKIENIDFILSRIQGHIPSVEISLRGPEEIFNNTLHPKKLKVVQVSIGVMSASQALQVYNKILRQIENEFQDIKIEVIDHDPQAKRILYNQKNRTSLMSSFLNFYRTNGMIMEPTVNGDYRARWSPLIKQGALKCENIF
jgi:hypothetical protein